jgi:hypothetical protein
LEYGRKKFYRFQDRVAIIEGHDYFLEAAGFVRHVDQVRRPMKASFIGFL